MYISRRSPINESNDYKIHQKVKSLFEGDQKVLWQQNSHSLYVLSELAPGKELDDCRQIDIGDVTQKGEQHIFSIRMNPVYRDTKTRKKIKIDNDKTNEWVNRKLKESGVDAKFKLSFDGYRTYSKNGFEVPAWTVMVKGFLTVIDSEKFRKSLTNGIGNLKFVGYGMINIFE